MRRYVLSRRKEFYYPSSLVTSESDNPHNPQFAAFMTCRNRQYVDRTRGRYVVYIFRPAGDTDWPRRLYKWSVYDDDP